VPNQIKQSTTEKRILLLLGDLEDGEGNRRTGGEAVLELRALGDRRVKRRASAGKWTKEDWIA